MAGRANAGQRAVDARRAAADLRNSSTPAAELGGYLCGGGTPFLAPVTEDVRLDLVETRTFGSRVIYERYRRTTDS